MKISEFLAPRNVVLELDVTDKRALIHELAKRAADELEISGAILAKALLEREKLGSTGTGDGIAIPHARIADVRFPFGLLARLRKPIEFDAIDGNKVDLIVLLLLPASSDGRHLSALAAVARQLRKRNIRQALKIENDASKIIDALMS